MSDIASPAFLKTGFRADPAMFVREDADRHEARLDLVVQGMHCAGCMRKIERNVGEMPGIKFVRANLSTKRVTVRWDPAIANAGGVVDKLAEVGFDAVPFDPQLVGALDSKEMTTLLRSLGVAGFAAANVMLLSVSVWSGALGGMDLATRALFYWASALIALPAIVYASQPFFRSAYAALRKGQMNMDVPISLAVTLATGMSFIQTMVNAQHVYFDASLTLLFFLLIGRYLDAQARHKACSAAQNLLGLRAVAANLVEADGTRRSVPVESLEPGMRIEVAAGQRFAADGVVETGMSDVDSSLVTGESLPQAVAAGSPVFAGTLNISAPMIVTVTVRDETSLLAEIVRLMENAEQGRSAYIRIADRAARIYAPAVHILALVTVLGWLAMSAGLVHSVSNAIAVLIVTCPCALGLAVPVVQVIATGRLLRRGVLVKSADGLERLAQIDTVVFDKTGTLTMGQPTLVNPEALPPVDMMRAASLARSSRHPLARALVEYVGDMVLQDVSDIKEEPGQGLEGFMGAERIRIGHRAWVGGGAELGEAHTGSELWYRHGDAVAVCLKFADQMRPDVTEVLNEIRVRGLKIVLLSGDRIAAVEEAAKQCGIDDWHGEMRPDAKVATLNRLAENGAKVLMVGDGLNDAPALRAAHVSFSPASAVDIAQTAADFVFQGARLEPLVEALDVARDSGRIVSENFGLAIAYNVVAVPLAMAGFVTPLIAAVAMSSSSITVTLNSLRLNRQHRKEAR